MKEYEPTSDHHHHQGEEVGNLLAKLRKGRWGYQGKFYSIGRQGNKPVSICLKLSDCREYIIPYSNITEITFDMGTGLVIYTTYKQYQITGRCLNELFEYLQGFIVETIIEHTGADTGEKGIFIGSINATDR